VRKRTRAITLNILFAVYFVSAVEPSSFAQEVKQSAAPSSPSGLPSLQAVKSCMYSAVGAECLDQLFREALGNPLDDGPSATHRTVRGRRCGAQA